MKLCLSNGALSGESVRVEDEKVWLMIRAVFRFALKSEY